jgi:uncharacterized protein (DUF2252 family)
MMASAAHELIASYNVNRDPERLSRKYAAMRTNPFVFLRGTAHVFFRRLRDADATPKAPVATCSGDLHLENFGTYLGDNGLTYFDINDFDESALAPASIDILRFATSILVAAPVIGLKRQAALELASAAIEAYRGQLLGGKARWIERRTSDGLIGDLMGGLKKRNQERFLEKRTVIKKGERRLQLDGERALAITKTEHAALRKFIADVGKARPDIAGFTFLDAARRVAGTGSLGVSRYVILLEGGPSATDHMLLDLKAALPSSLALHVQTKQPTWQNDAVRTVELQSRVQAVSPKFLQPVSFAGQPYVLKEMQPSADRLSLDAAISNSAALLRSIVSMSELSAWGQLRSSGRGGSATADDLIAYADDKKLTKALLDQALHCEAQVIADWRDFASNFDAGGLKV